MEEIELPTMRLVRKVKSMQMFHKPVESASQGDRLGMCVGNLGKGKKIERGIAVEPGSVREIHAAVAFLRKVKFFRGECKSSSKLHITIGHSTVMAIVTFFGYEILQPQDRSGKVQIPDDFNFDAEYALQEKLLGGKHGASTASGLSWTLSSPS